MLCSPSLGTYVCRDMSPILEIWHRQTISKMATPVCAFICFLGCESEKPADITEWRGSMEICVYCFSRCTSVIGGLKVGCHIWLMQITLTALTLQLHLTQMLKRNEWYRKTTKSMWWLENGLLYINHDMLQYHTTQEMTVLSHACFFKGAAILDLICWRNFSKIVHVTPCTCS